MSAKLKSFPIFSEINGQIIRPENAVRPPGLKMFQKRSKKFGVQFGEYARDFCTNTTLHGLRYVGDKNLSLFERSFFGLAFLIAFVVATQFILNVYQKWSSTPVIIGLSAIPFYITNIPFPAITICNMNQALASKVKNINKTSIEYSIVQTLCSRDADIDSETVNATSDWAIFQDFLLKNTQPCEKMLLVCKFGSVKMNCNKLFHSLLTDEGLCCTFNAVDQAFMYKNETNNLETLDTPDGLAINWTPERGYPKVLSEEFFPRTAVGTGSSLGLTVIMDAQISEYYCSSSNGAGFKVLLHNPTETPNVADTGILLKAGYETRVVITPHKSDASDSLRTMKKEYRQCIFDHEGNLSFFGTYSRRNCEIECEARLVAEECQCISYFMPKIIPNITICGLKDLKCRETVNRKVEQFVSNDTNCSEQCISSCFELNFSPEIFAAPINHSGFKIKDTFIQRISNEYAETNIASVHFYYMDKAFRSNTKEQFIGFTEFLSNTGGLMGLFLGFSFLSFVELVYYGTFRLYCQRRRMKPKKVKVESLSQFMDRPNPFARKGLNKIHNEDYDFRSLNLEVRFGTH